MYSLVSAADIVVSLRGHDTGSALLVVATEGDKFVLLCDGKRRKIERPKLKNFTHVQKIGRSAEAQQRLAQDETLSNSEIRKMLLPFRQGKPLKQ